MRTATAVQTSLSQTIFKGSVMLPENIIFPNVKVKAGTPAAVQLCASVHHVVRSSSGRCPYVREIITVRRGRSVWTGGLGWRGATGHQTGWQDSLVKLCCVQIEQLCHRTHRGSRFIGWELLQFQGWICSLFSLDISFLYSMSKCLGFLVFFLVTQRGLLGWQCRSASLSTTLVQSETSQQAWMDSDEVWYRHSRFPFEESY